MWALVVVRCGCWCCMPWLLSFVDTARAFCARNGLDAGSCRVPFVAIPYSERVHGKLLGRSPACGVEAALRRGACSSPAPPTRPTTPILALACITTTRTTVPCRRRGRPALGHLHTLLPAHPCCHRFVWLLDPRHVSSARMCHHVPLPVPTVRGACAWYPAARWRPQLQAPPRPLGRPRAYGPP